MLHFKTFFQKENKKMKILKISIITGIFLILNTIASAQIIDNYAVRIGAGFSNQYWNYKSFSNLSNWKDDKIGFIGQFAVEKEIGNNLSVRPAIGYIQKGFNDNITITTIEGDEIEIVESKMILHNISMDIAFKIKPIQSKILPYFLVGMRTNYLIDCKEPTIEFQGEEHEIYNELSTEFKNFTLDQILGIGFIYQNKYFLEIEYNPSLTKILDLEGITIKDRYFNLTLGCNINELRNN